MFPLSRMDERELPADFDGVVVTSDVDKTYLDTDFRSLKGLVAIPFEWGEDKTTLPGMGVVLRALRSGPGEEPGQIPLYFLTASPPQLAKPLLRKMLLDGVQCDGVTFKDWGAILFKHRKPKWIKRQLAYKVCALLHQREILPCGAREILIGDDMEIDALAYGLYADILGGHIDEAGLRRVLTDEGADPKEIQVVLTAVRDRMGMGDRVERAYILCVNNSDPRAFHAYSDGLVPCRSPFQLAVHLALAGRIRAEAVLETARAVIDKGAVGSADLARQLDDLGRRGMLTGDDAASLLSRLRVDGFAPAGELAPPDSAWIAPSRQERRGRWLSRY